MKRSTCSLVLQRTPRPTSSALAGKLHVSNSDSNGKGADRDHDFQECISTSIQPAHKPNFVRVQRFEDRGNVNTVTLLERHALRRFATRPVKWNSRAAEPFLWELSF